MNYFSKNRFLTEINVTLIECGKYSTAHGVPGISRAKNNFTKLMWTVCFMASVSYCCYSIIAIIIDYLKFGVLINMQVIYSSNTEFPAITICNLNPLDKRKSQFYIDYALAKNNLSYVQNISLIDMSPDQVKHIIMATIANDKNLTNMDKRSLGFEMDYMLLTCFYNDKPCKSSDFVWSYNFVYGNCFTFNSGFNQNGEKIPILKMSEPGSDRSFKLELFLGDEFLLGNFMIQSGAIAVVHNQSHTPLIEQEGILLSTNYQTDIGITRSFINKLDDPYSMCVKDSSSSSEFESFYYKAIFKILNETLYRQKECLSLCLQAYIKEKCKCLDGSLPSIYTNEHVCNSISEISCAKKWRITYSTDYQVNNCLECPLECNSVSYKLSVSKSRYPTAYYTQYLRHQTKITNLANLTDDNFIQKNIVLMNVFYADLNTLYVKEVPEITFDVLFGNIGGNLGLFVGVSILSFIEIVELIIQLILVLINDKKEMHS